MQVSKVLVALTVAAGFATASFAQGIAAPDPQAAPAAKLVAPAPAVAEKKVEAPKAAEAAKAETPKANAGKPVEKHTKAKTKAHKTEKHAAVPVAPAVAPAPVSK